jgi:predicted Fe-S protein YdhL (DUF1289 family)
MIATKITINPCTEVCYYDHDKGLCTGCGRTLEEIGDWSKMSENRKKEIINEGKKRLNILPPKDV